MLDAQALADLYVEAWNEPDAAKRSSAIAALWAPNAPSHNGGRGYAPLARLILVALQRTPPARASAFALPPAPASGAMS
jgi:hypothetical protein